MNIRIPTSSEPELAPAVEYPESDGEPMGETEAHILAIFALMGDLRHYFRSQPEVYVIADMFLYYEEGNPASRKAPDVMVVKGVETSSPRRTFKLWEEKAVPNAIFEVTSRKTWLEDLGGKRALYALLGVAEYFLFDPLHEYLDKPLVGYRLVGQDYVRMENASDGSLISSELGLRFCPVRTYLGVFDLQTGQRIIAPQSSFEAADWLTHQAQEEAQQARELARTADEHRRHAEGRAQAAEEELARLRALLAKLQGDKG